LLARISTISVRIIAVIARIILRESSCKRARMILCANRLFPFFHPPSPLPFQNFWICHSTRGPSGSGSHCYVAAATPSRVARTTPFTYEVLQPRRRWDRTNGCTAGGRQMSVIKVGVGDPCDVTDEQGISFAPSPICCCCCCCFCCCGPQVGDTDNGNILQLWPGGVFVRALTRRLSP